MALLSSMKGLRRISDSFVEREFVNQRVVDHKRFLRFAVDSCSTIGNSTLLDCAGIRTALLPANLWTIKGHHLPLRFLLHHIGSIAIIC